MVQDDENKPIFDPGNLAAQMRTVDTIHLVASLEEQYLHPEKHGFVPLHEAPEWIELKRRLTGFDPLTNQIDPAAKVVPPSDATDYQRAIEVLEHCNSSYDRMEVPLKVQLAWFAVTAALGANLVLDSEFDTTLSRPTWSLFLDDERDPPSDGSEWVICRSSAAALEEIERRGIYPAFISFDHDLGEDDTAIDFLRALLDVISAVERPLPFDYSIHSLNAVEAKKIESILKNYEQKYGKADP